MSQPIPHRADTPSSSTTMQAQSQAQSSQAHAQVQAQAQAQQPAAATMEAHQLLDQLGRLTALLIASIHGTLEPTAMHAAAASVASSAAAAAAASAGLSISASATEATEQAQRLVEMADPVARSTAIAEALMATEARLQQAVTKLQVHQSGMARLNELKRVLGEQDELIASFAAELKRADQRLGLIVDRSKTKLDVMKQAERGDVDPRDVIRYAHYISTVATAPPDWKEGMPLGIYSGPYPLETQMRDSLLYLDAAGQLDDLALGGLDAAREALGLGDGADGAQAMDTGANAANTAAGFMDEQQQEEIEHLEQQRQLRLKQMQQQQQLQQQQQQHQQQNSAGAGRRKLVLDIGSSSESSDNEGSSSSSSDED
ncbi:hypothetical protein CAOG_01207 [Capsaspora owczarzaki ATCC 30864]|uniref:Mediator of RNA polymerase II transcription subunit 4 n=1 Tax=Capsaspora owczarzaki (strain ATCC 30864) TaxID=595528 RepID=A0A0D2VIH3_CAPO3|nr:hypothetical protein CAOG_01207 [Capsaspora owczarzaki ATCC 30864]KJE89782.1 hypothetical protein CAOG_001207 [Capsaspora owczarzaki ATCC 30864]|eukprot:XP_004349704.1 hypothetical protein CAOG_01207 [Capsaspora owczarzaki ATCC 30864]